MITQKSLSLYLEASGWEHTHTTRAKSLVYNKENTKESLLVPTDKKLADYKELISTAIEILARHARTTTQNISERIMFQNDDIIRFKSESRYVINGAIPLYAWEKQYEFALRSLKAAASSIKKPTNVSKRLASKDAASFASKCLMGQTEIGSYIIKAMVPLGDYQARLTNPLEASIIPFGRQLSTTILNGAHIVSQIAKDVRTNTPPVLLEEFNKDRALSAICERICSSYEEMSDAFNNNLRLGINLSPSQQLPFESEYKISSVTLKSDYLEEIKEVRRIIVRDFKPKEETVNGFVIHLDKDIHKDEVEFGRIRIIDQDRRQINIVVGSEIYNSAINAHENKNPVKVTGTLKYTKRKYFMENISEFKVL